MKQLFEIYANYNQRINNQFYDLAGELDAKQLDEDRGLFFSSVIGTLNHIVVADITWLKRFATHPSNFRSLQFVRSLDQPEKLNAIVHPDLQDLRVLRGQLDQCILSFIRELDEGALMSKLGYTNFKGVQSTKQLGQLLLHFFNHQTHHRGQVSTAFTQLGLEIGVTDLLLEVPNA